MDRQGDGKTDRDGWANKRTGKADKAKTDRDGCDGQTKGQVRQRKK